MTMETIRTETDARGIATLTLARAEKHNALGPVMIAELGEAARRLDEDDDVRAVILAAEGRSFCAGADLQWMREQFTAAREQRIEQALTLARMLNVLNSIGKPLIGRIHGSAYGGGLGLIAICDAAVAVDTARFAFTETKLGIIPATISPYVLARMGEGHARRVFMSARIFDAREAVGLNLVSTAVPAEELDAALDREVEPYFATDPRAVASAKRLARSLGPVIDETVIRRTVEALADAWENPEARRRISAFLRLDE